jgi:hypothetical protein
MRKLGLNLNQLKVQTFETLQGGTQGGPLGALMGTRRTQCGSECGNCTYTMCHPDQMTHAADCFC